MTYQGGLSGNNRRKVFTTGPLGVGRPVRIIAGTGYPGVNIGDIGVIADDHLYQRGEESLTVTVRGSSGRAESLELYPHQLQPMVMEEVERDPETLHLYKMLHEKAGIVKNKD